MDKKAIEAELRKDLLARSGETFTFERTSGRLGWERTIPEGSGYSSYVTDAKDGEDLMKKAYTLASQMITAMDTPWKVRVRLNPGEGSGSFTDFHQVAVSTSVFDDPSLTIGQKMDTFLGFAVHEACHLLYTDPVSGSPDRLTRSLENILEDERIEHLCGERTPGLVKFIASAKYHSFDRHNEANAEALKSPGRLVRLINAILAYVRYPKALTEDLIDEFGEVLLKVRDILTPFPSSCSDVSRAARAIADLIREETEKARESSGGKKKEEEPSSDVDKGSGGSSAGSPGADGEASSSPASDGDAAGSVPAGRDTRSILSELGSLISDLSDEGGCLERKDVCEAVRSDSHLEEICEGVLERGSHRDSYFSRAKVDAPHEAIYDAARHEVSRYVAAIRRVLRCNGQELRRNLLGMRSGHFDCNKLADAFQGSQTVFRQQSVTRADRIAVCILIDESGSMIREGRMPAARKTAILLDEALSGVPGIDLYIYGHTADLASSGETNLIIYKEHGAGARKALGSAEARDNNRDGVAIREVARRVRRFTQDRCLLFVLSDGAPAAQNYTGRPAVQDTKDAVDEVTRMGFAPVQIAINASYDPSTMFSHYVVLEDLANLPKDLGRIIKDAILKNTSHRTA